MTSGQLIRTLKGHTGGIWWSVDLINAQTSLNLHFRKLKLKAKIRYMYQNKSFNSRLSQDFNGMNVHERFLNPLNFLQIIKNIFH